MKKVLCTYADFNACSQYRIIEPYSNIKSDPIQFDIIQPEGKEIVLNLDEALGYDALILQRAWDKGLIPYIKEFQDNGGKVVYEIDDDPFHIPKSNPYEKEYTPERLSSMREIINSCDALHVSTPELADAIPHHNKAVFLNGIDFSKYQQNWRDTMRKVYMIPQNAKVVMWAGSNSHADSLELIEQVIHQLVHDKIYVVLISNKTWLSRLGFYESEYLKIIDWIPLPVFYRIYYIADVVLAPLVDNGFNRCKSELRCIESSACGVPIVCSDVAPYIRFFNAVRANAIVEKERTKNWLNKIYIFLYQTIKHPSGNAVFLSNKYNLETINLERARWWENFLEVSAVHSQKDTSI